MLGFDKCLIQSMNGEKLRLHSKQTQFYFIRLIIMPGFDHVSFGVTKID